MYRLAITPNDTAITSVERAKAYFGDIKVWYPLETPTEETVQLPPIETFEGVNVFDIETKIKPSKVTITYYSKDKDGTVTANIN